MKKYLIALASLLSVGTMAAEKPAITITPAVNIVTLNAARKANISLDFNIPSNYLKTRSRLFLTPALMVGDSIMEEYQPIVLDAPIYSKKIHRREVLDKYVDPYSSTARKVNKQGKSMEVAYNQTVQLPEGVNGGRVVALVSTDGCGRCAALDTFDLAIISNPGALIDLTTMQTELITPEFVIRPKVHAGKGEARLQFVVNKWDIVMDLANNRAELTGMVDSLRPILADSLAQLTSLNIFGSASAEGSTRHNIMLAENRASSAKRWLITELNMPKEVQQVITIGARPEGWEPVVQAMREAGDADSTLVRDLMNKYPGPTDDAAEKYIRRLACWPRILKLYLAKDRKVQYDFTWTIKSFTNDDEMIRIYKTRPDAFNEEELLHVATLAADLQSAIETYRTTLRYFPESETALNNLTTLLIRQGHPEEVIAFLEGKENLPQGAQLNLATAYAQTGQTTRAKEMLSAIDSPQARYNLGVLKAAENESVEALELLSEAADVNSAIAALNVNDTERASAIMGATSDQSPRAEYIRAIIAARTRNEEAFKRHLEAIKVDTALGERALTEPEFIPCLHLLK